MTNNKFQATNVPIKNVIDYMSGNSGLTEEFIYSAMQTYGEKYVVLSSATEERTMMGSIAKCELRGKPLKVFEGQAGLLVARNGKAGQTKYLSKGKYTINDHAYILFVKDDCPYQIDLKWLAIQYRKEFLSFSSNSDNGTWNMTGFFKSVIIDIPTFEQQKRLIRVHEQAENLLNKFSQMHMKVEYLNNRHFVHDYNSYQAKNIPIVNVLDYISGSSEFTEEKNYLRLNNVGIPYQLMTGATTRINPPIVIINEKNNLSVFEDKEGLLVTRKGKAGFTRFLPPGKYALNDDAYILYQRHDSPYVIDLKWLSIQYKANFFDYASSSDNGTWNMTGFFKNTKIDIPDISEQKKVVALYSKLEEIMNLISDVENSFTGLLNKEINLYN